MSRQEIKEMVTLTATLRALLTEGTQQFNEQVGKALLTYLMQWRQPRPAEQPAEIARGLHVIVDQSIKSGLAQDAETAAAISCRKGCAHCCHMRVGILPEEAYLLVEAAEQKGWPIDRAKMEQQATYGDDDEWLTHSKEERRCLFLNDAGECQVYEARPMACRKYFVLTPPEECDIDQHPGEQVAIWFDTYAEVLASAGMTHFGADSLPQMVKMALLGMQNQKNSSFSKIERQP